MDLTAMRRRLLKERLTSAIEAIVESEVGEEMKGLYETLNGYDREARKQALLARLKKLEDEEMQEALRRIGIWEQSKLAKEANT